MKITFFFRKRQSGYHSIEEVFNTIIPIIGSAHQTNRITAPCQSTILGVIPNWLYTFWRRADIIHITGDAHYLGLFSKSPLVITVHDLASIFRSKSILNIFKKWLWVNGPLKRAAQVVAISENTRNEISQMLPEVDHKTTVIPNPISSLFKFSPKTSMNEAPIILHIGTATHKNLVKVINAIADQKVELVILGLLSSPQKQLLDETFMAYQNFSGLTYEEVYQLYLKADIISFPSEYEGFGMPIIEAQATGRPVLTSNFPSLRQTAGDRGALFIDIDNDKALKDGFKKLLQNAELRGALIKAGQSNVKRYQADSIAQQYLNLYDEMINKS